MTEVVKAWYLFSFSFGCWTCLNLLVSRRGDHQIKRSMMAFIILLLLPPLYAYLALALGHPVAWLYDVNQQLTWAFGPLILIHVRHVLLQKIPRWHFVLHALPFVISVSNGMTGWRLASIGVMTVLLFIQLFGYLGYTLFLLKAHKNRILQLTQQFQNTTYYWLLFLVGGLLFITLFDVATYAVMILGYFPPISFSSAVASALAIFVNTIALFALYQPSIFMHELMPEVVESELVKPNFRVIELTPQAALELDEQLQQLVVQHKPHLDEDISLNKLAALLGVTSHQLSELLNVHKNISFYDFLNDLRYQESLLMLGQRNEELTIADIAYRSGFNNRNSFYKVFKEKTGVTPSQYKKSM